MLVPWIRQLFVRPTRTLRRRDASASRQDLRGFRPALEALEDRVVPAFLAPTTYAVGAVPTAIAVGDFNGDGRQDIVTVNSTSIGAVSVLLGNGDGTFQAAISSGASTAPGQLAVGDFDGDGKLDLAVGSSNAINILKGNGDGSFQAPVVYAIGGTATHLAAADFNNDGHADLVLSTVVYGGTAMVLMNHGDGTFAPPTNLAAGASAMDVKVGDVNNDGKQDLVIANQFSGSTVSVILGNGDGTFQSSRSYAGGSAPYKTQLGDFNHDGNLDIVALNSYTSSAMSVLLGNGDGTYKPSTTYYLNAFPNDVEAADFNGDGNIDLIEPTGGGYQVELGRGDGSFYAPVNYSTTTGSRNAIGDFNGDGVADVATSSPTGNVIVLVNANDSAVNLAGATGLQITAPATAVAGQTLKVTVTAIDATGNLAVGFTGTVAVTSGAQALTQPYSYTFTAADGGTHTFANVPALTTAGVQTVTVTSSFLPAATQSVEVTAATATHFTVSTPPTAFAGVAMPITVTALDAYGNIAVDFTRTVTFSSSDVQAVLPAAYTFSAADAGVHTFSAILKSAGLQTITARDAAALVFAGTSSAVAVTPDVTSSLSLSGGGGFIGSPHTVTVTARDLYGNAATSYSGTVHLASSDPGTTVSADVTLVNGVGTFQVTPRTIGTQSLTATDTAGALVAGIETITVTPGWAVRFVATPLAATVAGNTQAMTVTAYDAFGNVSTVYTGFALITTSDPQAGSFYYGFTAADAGVHTFGIALRTAGVQSVSVTDYADATITVKQSGIVVTPAAAASLTVSALHGTTAGVSQTFTVTARDAFGNVATGYVGTLAFSTSDKQAALLASYTFTAADAGVHTFNVTFKSSGGATFAVQDVANAANLAFNSSQRDIQITAAALAGLSIQAPSNVSAGTAFNVKVSAVDAFGNVVTGYTGKMHFSGPSGVPADYTFSAADAGTHLFTMTWTALGTQTLGAADTTNGSLKTQASITVKTAASSGGGATGGVATGGVATGGVATGGGATGGGGKRVVV